MKQPMTSILKMFTLALLLVSGTACTDNFDKINSKDYQVTKQEQERENYNLGTTLRGLQGLVIPTQEHSYQFIEALAAGPFAGYFGAINPWTTKFETYNPSVDWIEATFLPLSPIPILTTAIYKIKAMTRWHWHWVSYYG